MFSRSTIFLATSALVLSISPAAAQDNPVISEEMPRDDALQSTKWLAGDYAIAQIPSLQSLAFLRKNAKLGSNTFFGVGDPVLAMSLEIRRCL